MRPLARGLAVDQIYEPVEIGKFVIGLVRADVENASGTVEPAMADAGGFGAEPTPPDCAIGRGDLSLL